MKNVFLTSLAAFALGSGGVLADGKINVITSFPDSMTSPIEAAFEAANPQYDLEILNKKTSAGVKYIQEISSDNTADIFWASAPDAFEVLKSDDLLARVKVNSTGIPDKIGSYPLNDPSCLNFCLPLTNCISGFFTFFSKNCSKVGVKTFGLCNRISFN